jgi:hypothetical protein
MPLWLSLFPFAKGTPMKQQRQKILILYLSNSALDSRVKGWTQYDGTGRTAHTTGDSETPPYATGLDALLDGWRAIQFPQLIPPYPGLEYATSFHMNEFIFEKLETIDG